MQHLHRSTLYRRRQKPPASKGRRRGGLSGGVEEHDRKLLCKLLRAAYERGRAVRGRSDFASGRAVSMADAETSPEDAVFQSLERRMINSAEPVPVLILAAWSKLRPEIRRRAVNRRGAKDPRPSEKIADILRVHPKLTKSAAARIAADEKAAIHELRRDHNMSQAAAEKLVRSQRPRGSGWVQELARQSCDATHKFIEPTNIPACPSRWFKTSRRMFSYWRTKEGDTIDKLGDELLDLIYSSTLDKFAE